MPNVAAHIHRNSSRYVGGVLSAAVLAIAIPFVSGWEGTITKPYRDSVGVLTICDGATAADGVDFSKTYTKADCLAMLGRDMPKYDEQAARCIDVDKLPPHRHVAVISLVYNIGGGAFCRSTVAFYLADGQTQKACDAFLGYDHAGGRVLPGLTNRRRAERKLCLMDN